MSNRWTWSNYTRAPINLDPYIVFGHSRDIAFTVFESRNLCIIDRIRMLEDELLHARGLLLDGCLSQENEGT